MATVAGRLAFAQKIATKYSPQIASLLGLQNRMPTYLQVGQTSNGNLAESDYMGGITFSKDFLLGTSRADLRGNVIHEMTHVLGGGYGKPKAETVADYARYMLNHGDPSWSPSQAVMKMAARRGESPVSDPNSGPPQGNNRRMNNSARNKNSKQALFGGQNPSAAAAGMGGLTMSQVADVNSGLLQANDTFAQQMAAWQAQRAQGVATKQAAMAAAKAAGISGAMGIQGDALSRGVLGSSATGQAFVGNRAEMSAAQTAAKSDFLNTLQTVIQEKLAAQQGLNEAQMSALQTIAQDRAENAINTFSNGFHVPGSGRGKGADRPQVHQKGLSYERPPFPAPPGYNWEQGDNGKWKLRHGGAGQGGAGGYVHGGRT